MGPIAASGTTYPNKIATNAERSLAMRDHVRRGETTIAAARAIGLITLWRFRDRVAERQRGIAEVTDRTCDAIPDRMDARLAYAQHSSHRRFA